MEQQQCQIFFSHLPGCGCSRQQVLLLLCGFPPTAVVGAKQQQPKDPMVTMESGLQYEGIKVSEGPSPPIGFQVAQVVANYVAMVPNGQIFDRYMQRSTSNVIGEGTGTITGIPNVSCPKANLEQAVTVKTESQKNEIKPRKA